MCAPAAGSAPGYCQSSGGAAMRVPRNPLPVGGEAGGSWTPADAATAITSAAITAAATTSRLGKGRVRPPITRQRGDAGRG